jgi:drug/metabolite transporter (DMT)-like permease
MTSRQPTTPSALNPGDQIPLGVGLGILAALIWGAYLATARAGAASGLLPADIAFIRFATAGAILLPWLLRHDAIHLAGVGWKKGAALALLAGPAFIFMGVGGYHFAPLAHGAVFQPAALTIGGMALAALLLGDKFTRIRLIGAGVIVLGLAVVAGPGLLGGGAQTLLGDLMFATAGMMWALFTALTRKWNIAPLPATAAVSVLSAVAYVPWFVSTHGLERIVALPTDQIVMLVLLQGVLSGVVAIIAFTRAVQILGAGRAAVFPAIVPAVAILIGIPVAHEIPTLMQGLGVAIVLTGLMTIMGLLRFPNHFRFAGR